jgi:sulfate permease, SulP family
MTGQRLLPDWLRHYQRRWLASDFSAGLIAALLLIPQSLAYALVAGMPAQTGLYASILPVLAYAVFGSSMSTAVGPVALTSLMTFSALQPLADVGTPAYQALALLLALISGLMLMLMGLLRLGFLAYFLSQPVVSGFVSGSAVLIAVGQVKHLLGVQADGSQVLATVWSLLQALPATQPAALAMGTGSLLWLWLARRYLGRGLVRLGMTPDLADLGARLAPLVVVVVATVVAAQWGLAQRAGLAVVGVVPQGLPHLQVQGLSLSSVRELLLPALLISLVGFVGSVSVAQSFALKRQQRVLPDRELLGLGAANLASAASGAFPVSGGFSRTVVNFAAGAQTPLSGVFSALWIGVVIFAFTGWFEHVPQAVLAATIIVAVASLVDVQALRDAWRYDRADALALLATAAGVLLLGVEAGIGIGVALSLAVLVWRSSRPNMAVLGRVPGTEHFRSVERHQVQTVPGLLALRVDESLFFANATIFEDRLQALLRADPAVRRVLLVCSAVNQIDTTALSMLTELDRSLEARGIQLQLAEVKGALMDRLQRTPLGQALQGRLFLSTHDAFEAARLGDTVRATS